MVKAGESWKQVVADINRSVYYSVIADETHDNINMEQLWVAVRYFDVKSDSSEEKFLAFVLLELLYVVFVVCINV